MRDTTMASTRHMARTRAAKQRGFTLIELMIAVAIVALLAAIAYPSYQDSVWKGKRGEAKAAILRTLQSEERYYTQNNTYITYTAGTPPSGSSSFPGYSGDSPTTSRYSIGVSLGGSTLCSGVNDASKCVVVTATVIGSADPKCGTALAMDTVGNKYPALTGATALCWK